MKYLAILVFGLLLLFQGCCYGDDGYYSERTTYGRKIKLTDVSDRILKISYKNSNKVYYPNDTIADLIISDNTENTLYIETQKTTDTIVLRVEVNYSYKNENCASNQLTKEMVYTPKIVSHTFQNVVFDFVQVYDTYYYNPQKVYDVLTITP